MREKLPDQQPSMDGGLNSISAESALQPNQLRRAINCRLTEFGAVAKRGGLQRTSSAALSVGQSVLNGYTWRQDSGTTDVLAVCNGSLFTSSYGTLPWTWTQETGTLSTTVIPQFAQFRDTGGNDVVYISDGGLLNKWDGTTLTTNLSGTASCKVIVVHNERLWGCGSTTSPDSIFYSALMTETRWAMEATEAARSSFAHLLTRPSLDWQASTRVC